MAVAYGAAPQPGLLSQQFPPPLLPKPGKDNARLQKLLKRTAKKKASTQVSQSVVHFRSSLSPVNEASPDLEHSDHSTPPRTPETPSNLYTIKQPQRFTVRPLYQHVASPYPQRASYGRATTFSPQTVGVPSYSYSQHVTTVSSYSAHIPAVSPAQGPATQPAVPKISLTAPAAAVKKPASGTFAETQPGAGPAVVPPQTKSPGLTPYSAAGGQAIIRPLTVLTPLVKSRSPRPTFKATEPSRSPKPMFDVPQIRMYTASTSYYETSRTPPVYDTSELTAIGTTVPQSKIPAETKQDLTHTSLPEVARGSIQAAQPTSMGSDPQRKTPTSEMKRVLTPTAEVKTQSSETKRVTLTTETKRATPTSEIRVKTPTYEFQSRISAGRPKTPAFRVSRAATPVFEISRPNPLLFAVSPITVEPESSRTPKTAPAESSLSVPNGHIFSDPTPAATPIYKSMTEAKPEPVLTREKVPAASADSLRPKTPPSEPTTPAAIISHQRPKTPTYEASRLMTTSPGYKRPKTPTGVSPVAFSRPRTPTHVAQKSKSSYRGLTPAEYAAYGGIKTYSPAFGITTSKTSSQEGSAESKTESQEPSVKAPSTAGASKEETPIDEYKPPLREKVPATPTIPVIVVSQPSEPPRTTLTQETSRVKLQKTVIQEPPKPKPPTAEEKVKVETPVQEPDKPQTKTPEAKRPLPRGGDKDPLMAVRKLLGKDKVQMAEPKPKAATETKAAVSEQKEPVKLVTATTAKAEVSKPISAAESTESEVKGKGKKAEPAEKKEGDKALPAAEPLLKVMQKPKGLKTKPSGWSRLKKHMVVEQEEPKFPEIGSRKETAGQDQNQDKETADAQGESNAKETPKATQMWDAVLFQMFSTKENILHQIELNKSEQEKVEETRDETKEIPSFAYRLPVLLFSPKFDAKRLKEAASRPVTKISTVFEMGLIGRKGKEEEPKDFNRTARGFTAT
ncbi:nascent polypeptide-associated complex subunit alpha, muscle-specific form [Echeneis naucrates]|uniref:Nascent polypeptide-associated complex subunit alpha, muscle-specific form-like n=1 Tax=Echeneis naucrates TaxID=173247 RepID=A0A665T807_ECHNA|nr:nascent polypeptide-associated complex subunit alpha, muscle-specific form-like [Echeneis naucrates]XP_029378410.1 nascent polypeptide-associated complex subunit alpha, muscle-specific form-like [Echeneis naucrates]XP_029378411.1 nascent polypeptide-associated complex subunit alpha, muscle-specific form-like [Echeneis naucrates]XP_029378412.1 nascent polypeptide-associated complex subunit alpha, muscle-specific form-like [Echeneis naucrates]